MRSTPSSSNAHALDSRDMAITDGLGALWSYLSSWIAADGGLNGPVVHRGDLKRLFAIHDTPWTQHAVIEGLLHLHRRSGGDYWLATAVRLADAQCARQETSGRFRWAGHEDDRFSALVHNAMADCALLDLAAVLPDRGDASRRDKYLGAAERNLEEYLIGSLYRPELGGFAMAHTDFYAHRDRFIVNMNSVAVEALIKLDRCRGTDRHSGLVRSVGERMLSLQSHDGLSRGSLAYSDLEPDVHIPLYSALALRGVPGLAAVTGNAEAWARVARDAVEFLCRMQDPATGLWYHKVVGGTLFRFPMFVAGAGIICNGILDAAEVTGSTPDSRQLAGTLLRFQLGHGAIRNFVGYDHPDNGRRGADGVACWEDVYPTPNWNAQAFHFLSRIARPPDPPRLPARRRTFAWSRRYIYCETERVSAVFGLWPPGRATMLVCVKRLRHAALIPAPLSVLRAVMRAAERFPLARAATRWLRKKTRSRAPFEPTVARSDK